MSIGVQESTSTLCVCPYEHLEGGRGGGAYDLSKRVKGIHAHTQTELQVVTVREGKAGSPPGASALAGGSWRGVGGDALGGLGSPQSSSGEGRKDRG